MFKAIFLDLGDTFSKGFKNMDKELNELLKPFGLVWQKFIPIWRNFYILRSSGRIKNDRELEIMIKRVTQREVPVQEIIKIIIESQIVPREHINIVRELKKKYKIGILSNNVQGWVEKVLKNYKIENLFDALIVSSKVGARKPDALIYYAAIKKFSIKPKEAIFVADEVAEDLVPATGLGMKTIWLKTSQTGWWNEDDKKILKIYQPDATIKSFKELIPTIKKLEKYGNKNF